VAQLDRVKVPAKSTIQRYATWLPEEDMREVINVLLRKAGAAMVDGKQVLDLEEPLDLSKMLLDTTCVKANIHFPIDWVLLRDGVKSLMQSVELIRTHGLRSRMCEPQVFITKIKRLSMEMTHTRRKKNGHKERKRRTVCVLAPLPFRASGCADLAHGPPCHLDLLAVGDR
jgi:hypothetical protein